jgi:hypothetical protein
MLNAQGTRAASTAPLAANDVTSATRATRTGDEGGVKDERKEEVERQYQTDRAAILGDGSMSWEKKLRAVLELFNRYRDSQEEGREED